MNPKRLIFLLLFVLLFSGCIPGNQGNNMPTATPTPQLSATPTPVTAVTPNITDAPTATATAEITPSPTAVITAEHTTVNPTPDPDLQERTDQMNAFLPPLNTNLRFFGIAETGHYGELSLEHTDDGEAMYEFSGVYDDGMGVPDEFSIQYFFNYNRGTITEKAGYNERLDKKEFHSKLHNVVVLKFPLSLGATWSHATKIEGQSYWVYAEVIEYDGNKVKVLYTAEGVPDYYNETYFEIRTYEKGYGMTSFGNIMTGDLDMTGVDTSDEQAVREHIMNMHMFGYSLDKSQN